MQTIADLKSLLEVANADFDRVSIYPDEIKDFAMHIREQVNGSWTVYYMEKGTKSAKIDFDDFWQAGRYLLGSVYAEAQWFIKPREQHKGS